MLEAIRGWLETVLLTALVLAVLEQLLPPEGPLRLAAGFTGGLVLTVAVLHPLPGLAPGSLNLHVRRWTGEIEKRQEELMREEQDQLAERIAERTAAYISDKAASLGLSAQVRVCTEPGKEGIPLPYSAEVTCVRNEALAAYMADTLGIPRERQVWHGPDGAPETAAEGVGEISAGGAGGSPWGSAAAVAGGGPP